MPNKHVTVCVIHEERAGSASDSRVVVVGVVSFGACNGVSLENGGAVGVACVRVGDGEPVSAWNAGHLGESKIAC